MQIRAMKKSNDTEGKPKSKYSTNIMAKVQYNYIISHNSSTFRCQGV